MVQSTTRETYLFSTKKDTYEPLVWQTTGGLDVEGTRLLRFLACGDEKQNRSLENLYACDLFMVVVGDTFETFLLVV